MDILQEILRQQQVLRIQQDALQNQQIPAAAAAAAAAPDPAPPLPVADDDVAVPAPDPLPLNALQGWQLQWQQQQQQHLRHLQPFLAEPLGGGPVRPGLPAPAPPGAVHA